MWKAHGSLLSPSLHSPIPARIADSKGYSFFFVNLNDKNVMINNPIFRLGLHACPIVEITLDSVSAQIIGNEG